MHSLLQTETHIAETELFFKSEPELTFQSGLRMVRMNENKSDRD